MKWRTWGSSGSSGGAMSCLSSVCGTCAEATRAAATRDTVRRSCAGVGSRYCGVAEPGAAPPLPAVSDERRPMSAEGRG